MEELDSAKQTVFDKARQGIFFILSLVALIFAILRAYGVTKVDHEVLYFLGTAGAFLVLERVKRLNIGKDGISYEVSEIKAELKKVGEQVSEVKANVNETIKEEINKVDEKMEEVHLATAQGVGGKLMSVSTIAKTPLELQEGIDPSDPQKGRFGGQSQNNGRKLTATVTASENFPGNYNILLKVSATKGSKPLSGIVTFHIHNTFKQPIQKVPVKEGNAQLALVAYGAFTVGAVVDEIGEDRTMLELDLAEIEEFPYEFRKN